MDAPESLPVSAVNPEPIDERIYEYHPTPFQIEICNAIMPSLDDQDTKSGRAYIGPLFCLSQAFKVSCALDQDLVYRIASKLGEKHRVLSTLFYRNEKILDADLECHLDATQPLVEQISIETNDDAYMVLEQVLLNTETWRSKIGPRHVWGIQSIETISEQPMHIVLFAGSSLVLDQPSLSWLEVTWSHF